MNNGIEFTQAVPYESSMYRRCQSNSLFELIDEELASYFGPIVIMIKGSIMVNPLLYDCYIRDFVNHRNERELIHNLDTLYGPDISFYSDIKKWIDGQSNIVHSLLGISDEIYPLEWSDPHYPRVLCGPKGCGKTTHLLFTKTKIENNEKISNKCHCIYIRLPTRSFGEADNPEIYIRDEIIHKIDDVVLINCEMRGISQDRMNLDRFERFWKHHSIWEEESDDKRTKSFKKVQRYKLLVRLHQNKYKHEFDTYLLDSLNYIEKELEIKLVIMIDDVDRLESLNVARKIVDNTKALARKLGTVPVIISAREETVALLNDSDVYAYKLPIIPPSFSNVINKRRNKFIKDFKLGEEKRIKAEDYDLSEKKIKDYIDLICDSILAEPTYTRLASFHYDLDILLDIFRCIATSPFIQHTYLDELIQEHSLIPWNVILDSMQRYYYINFYQENSFILNLFDNMKRPASKKNALIRIRLLQVLQHRFAGINEPIKTTYIYEDMCSLGYRKKDVINALSAFASQRLIATGRYHNKFEERSTLEIIPHRAIIFYLNYLIKNYRYIQNILPVTPVPFSMPLDITESFSPLSSTAQLKVIDKLIFRFIDFIKECEKSEQEKIVDISLFNEVTRELVLSNEIRKSIIKNIDLMKSGKEDKC